jgi:hypothetical protein
LDADYPLTFENTTLSHLLSRDLLDIGVLPGKLVIDLRGKKKTRGNRVLVYDI